ncbi:hypothetical protein QQ045_010853 [Rhodiola kirilowii]
MFPVPSTSPVVGRKGEERMTLNAIASSVIWLDKHELTRHPGLPSVGDGEGRGESEGRVGEGENEDEACEAMRSDGDAFSGDGFDFGLEFCSDSRLSVELNN